MKTAGITTTTRPRRNPLVERIALPETELYYTN
jgi:hypothetical protein